MRFLNLSFLRSSARSALCSASVSAWVSIIGLRSPALLPLLAVLFGRLTSSKVPAPFDKIGRRSLESDIEDLMPRPVSGARRSLILLYNNYYHFLHLAEGLRRRGWDAVLVNLENPRSPSSRYFHGEDVNLFTEDPEMYERRLQDLYRLIPRRFRMLQFTGMQHMSIFPENFGSGSNPGLPWDFLALKGAGVKIGYTISGCNDGIRQSVFRRHTGVCTKCAWENQPHVCSDARNFPWGQMLSRMCDLVACEEDYALDYRTLAIGFQEPLTMCLDPEKWKPDLAVPSHLKIPREEGEILILHGFGNKAARTLNGRDIKGSHAIHTATERLRSEGRKVRLIAPVDVPSVDMRFLQVQSDIIVDQLNYGRYGAQAREGQMLGKPTICFLDARQGGGLDSPRGLRESPLVQATEDTIYDVLKRLVDNPESRREIGRRSRIHAVKWHSADACARRFEEVYDQLMSGIPPAKALTTD